MNKKGILFSVMAVLMVLAILSLIQLISQKRRESQQVFEAVQLIEVKNHYSNIEKDIIDLVKKGIRKDMAERTLPFSYNIDGNKLFLKQELPLRQNVWDGFFDLINTYAIFVSDKNFLAAYAGLEVDANTIKTGGQNSWGGSAEKLQFLVDPFCTGIAVDRNGKNLRIGDINNSRCSSYNFGRIRWVDVNIVVKFEVEDYNSIVWDRNDAGTALPDPVNCSSGGCPNQDYSALDTGLYYRFFFNDSACLRCGFQPGAQKTIRERLPYTSKVNIKISCAGTGCNSDEVNLSIDNGLLVTHPSDERIDVIISTQFDSNITRLYFLDFNYSVKGRDFNIFKTNNPTGFN